MNKLNRSLSVLIVLILVIGLPVVSYYYLKSGYLFRKDALDKMQLNMPLHYDDLDLKDAKGEMVNSKIQLFHFDTKTVSDPEWQRLLKVQELFNDSDRFSLWSIGKTEGAGGRLAESIDKAKNWHYIYNPQFLDTLRIFSKEKLLLVDSTGMGRAQYSFDEDQMRELVKHITVLFPIKKRSKIKLERETNN